MAKYQLPELPYAYNALEPHYDEQTVRLHHDAHHKAYVEGLNNADAKLVEAWEKEISARSSTGRENWLFTVRGTSCIHCSGTA